MRTTSSSRTDTRSGMPIASKGAVGAAAAEPARGAGVARRARRAASAGRGAPLLRKVWVEEVADAMGISPATVKRGWQTVRVWLAHDLRLGA